MEDKKIIARQYDSLTNCTLVEDGYWKAINEIHDKVLYEGETEWIEEIIDAMALDKDPHNAIQVAMSSSLNYMLQNVYHGGFAGLVEYRQYERQLEASKNASKIESIQDS